jgi:hypothetical protein
VNKRKERRDKEKGTRGKKKKRGTKEEMSKATLKTVVFKKKNEMSIEDPTDSSDSEDSEGEKRKNELNQMMDNEGITRETLIKSLRSYKRMNSLFWMKKKQRKPMRKIKNKFCCKTNDTMESKEKVVIELTNKKMHTDNGNIETRKERREEIMKRRRIPRWEKIDRIMEKRASKWKSEGKSAEEIAAKREETEKRLEWGALKGWKVRENITILTINIQGNWEEKSFLLATDAKELKADIIHVQETHLKAESANIETDRN